MINTLKYIEKYLKIKDKRADIRGFKLNGAQMKLYNAVKSQYAANKPVRIIILKARQMGFSTLAEALIFKEAAVRPNITSGIVAHEAAATDNLFKMSKRFYENLPEEIKPPLRASNAKELIFDFAGGASSVKCMTAGNENIGRSDTFLNLHVSEYAFWGARKKDILTGLLQSVPNHRDTSVIIESTANGFDDFKDRWDAAVLKESDFIPVFCAWWEHGEYSIPCGNFLKTEEEWELAKSYGLTDAQLNWRRWCIRNNCGGDINKFRQEYPSCPEEAFIMSGAPVFDNEIVIKRIAELERGYRERLPKTGRFKYEFNDGQTKDMILDGSIVFAEDGRQIIRIFEEPKEGVAYVIGADTKGEGGDYYAASVIDNSTGKRVAALKMQCMESKPFTYQLYCLARYFKDAYVAVEANFNTAPIEELERLGYANQYARITYDDFTKKEQKRYGFRTDGVTRPLIIDKEISEVNLRPELFTDAEMLRECLTFVYDARNRPDAIAGKHDDMLMADMIANEVRGYYPAYAAKPQARRDDGIARYLDYGS